MGKFLLPKPASTPLAPAPQHPQTPPIGILIELTQSIQISVYTIVLAVTQYHSYIVIDYFYLFRII